MSALTSTFIVFGVFLLAYALLAVSHLNVQLDKREDISTAASVSIVISAVLGFSLPIIGFGLAIT